jgi:hypothetical protein
MLVVMELNHQFQAGLNQAAAAVERVVTAVAEVRVRAAVAEVAQ